MMPFISNPSAAKTGDPTQDYPHYFKSVAGLKHIDVYRVLQLFGVTDQGIGHAVKKLLCSGGRGAKDFLQDVREARDTLQRVLDMAAEDAERAPRRPGEL